MSDDHDIVITSDLHLDLSSSEIEHAFARMTQYVEAGGCRTVVLLADTFNVDIVPTDPTDATDQPGPMMWRARTFPSEFLVDRFAMTPRLPLLRADPFSPRQPVSSIVE